MASFLCNHGSAGVAERTEAEANGSPNNNENSGNSSPWPAIEDAAVVFLLDARDDFEARLLRNWVETQKPESGTRAKHWFVGLSNGRADDLMAALPEQGNAVWMQPLRIAWLPTPAAAGRCSLQDFFY